MDGREFALGVDNLHSIHGVQEHSYCHVDGHQWMTDKETIEQALHDIGVPNIMGEPSDNPRNGKEGFHIYLPKLRVDLFVKGGNQGHHDQAKSCRQRLKVGLHGVAKVRPTDLEQNTRWQVQAHGRCSEGCLINGSGATLQLRSHLGAHIPGRPGCNGSAAKNIEKDT